MSFYEQFCPPCLVSEKEFPKKMECLQGFSKEIIEMHWQLYQGYVKKTNLLREKLLEIKLGDENPDYTFYRGLKLEETFANNGYKLHELYFDNLAGAGGAPSGRLWDAVLNNFCSYNIWKERFMMLGTVMRGWAVLVYNYDDGCMYNIGLDSHDNGMLARVEPLLVMDVYEHAYHMDFGNDKKAYVKAFFNNINWNVVSKRYHKAKEIYNLMCD